ncbi:MAG TPA: S8 family serine peptidase [Thermoanaerobaculia bacterium]|nr:S8 family serine peptidase [Thermoanaerobaculia bacterium]
MRKLFVAILVCAAGFVHAAEFEAAPGVHFTGEFLVSVRGDVQPMTRAAISSGWTARKLATVHSTQTDTAPRSNTNAATTKTWFLVSPPPAPSDSREAPREHPWDAAHRHVARKAAGESSVLANLDLNQIVEIEPVVAYEMRGFGARFARAAARAEAKKKPCEGGEAGTVIACGPASFQWPNVKETAWHQNDDRTELRKARERAASSFTGPNIVRIAHLDTGYYKTNDTITPPNFDFDLSQSMIPNDNCGETGIDCYQGGLPNGHGPETLSVLAGGKVKFAGGNGYPAYEDYIGGAPLAQVFTYRVSPSVILIWPMYVAGGIFNAVDNKADVISMSMGGAPSYFLRDAVNEAYANGVPMFFAAADFLRLPIPFIPIEIPPHTMVYPARFSTATPVSGMTAGSRSYGLNPSWFLSVFRGDAFSWIMRGSYGPAHLMSDRALTTYSPNITSRHGTSAFVPNQIQFSFAGTSAATPQAAAAAALWLQMHRNEFTEDEWRSWVKAQAAYDALVKSADLPNVPHATEYFGAGIVKANRALDVPKGTPVRRPNGEIGVDWITELVKILGINPNDPPPTGVEAEEHRSMLQLEVAQLLTTEPKLRDIVNGDFEHRPSDAQLRRLRRAIAKNERASSYLRRAAAAKRAS